VQGGLADVLFPSFRAKYHDYNAMIAPPTIACLLMLASLLPEATFAQKIKPKSESAASNEEDLILGFRGKRKYQIVVHDPMPNEAAGASVGRRDSNR